MTARVRRSTLVAALESLGIDAGNTLRVTIDHNQITMTEFAESGVRTIDPDSPPENPFYHRVERVIGIEAG